ncbi:glutamate--tRNA ligase [Clostridium sp.]|uniref:glutamate--tRNA ligase n=1 Tax=Clostridium sp. TaxID=1506 RepID=UPI0034645E39
MDYKVLAEAMLKDITKEREDYLGKYKKRNLKEGAKVTRYAPSPTGFQHIGGVFAALTAERIAKKSGGVFYLRIEDTDQKREVEGAISDTIKTMHNFNIEFDEGMVNDYDEKGDYGPYKQSKRGEIYKTFAKELVEKGLAYPCFCSEEEISKIREEQTSLKENPGYYGKWARCRNLSVHDAVEKINKGEKFVIRLKSPGDIEKRVEFHDLVKGDISFPENNQDIVIVKSDGLPTYHFAHAIDDALMGTTHVTRGEEWLPSLPIHVQLFDVLGFTPPSFAHIPQVMKLDGEAKRKLSKRKDPESAVSYYREEGYPTQSVIEYLLNIINSNFEEWREENPKTPYTEFNVELEKMSKSGALFDIVKLNDVSKNVICRMTEDEMYNLYVEWAKEYSEAMYKLVTDHEAMTKAIFNIDKDGAKPRKDYGKWNEVEEKIYYFFDELFYGEDKEAIEMPKNISLEEAKRIIDKYKEIFDISVDQETWFKGLKEFAVAEGYAADRKSFKKDPESFKGMVSDVAGIVRSALTHRTNTPDLYTIMVILGEEKVRERFNKFI